MRWSTAMLASGVMLHAQRSGAAQRGIAQRRFCERRYSCWSVSITARARSGWASSQARMVCSETVFARQRSSAINVRPMAV